MYNKKFSQAFNHVSSIDISKRVALLLFKILFKKIFDCSSNCSCWLCFPRKHLTQINTKIHEILHFFEDIFLQRNYLYLDFIFYLFIFIIDDFQNFNLQKSGSLSFECAITSAYLYIRIGLLICKVQWCGVGGGWEPHYLM